MMNVAADKHSIRVLSSLFTENSSRVAAIISINSLNFLGLLVVFLTLCASAENGDMYTSSLEAAIKRWVSKMHRLTTTDSF